MGDRRNGIVHVVGPELGFTLPGMTIVCGDSHTSHPRRLRRAGLRHRRQRSASTCWPPRPCARRKPKRMRVTLRRARPRPGVGAKDFVLALIGGIGTGGGTGYAIEYAGPAIAALSMEGRMTLCNMSIEAGAASGMVAPDETTFAYLKGRPLAPKGGDWDAALAALASAAHRPRRGLRPRGHDRRLGARAAGVTWGTSPEDVIAPIDGRVPDPAAEADPGAPRRMQRALDYMGLTPGQPLDRVADRPGVHRLLHQQPHRGPARRPPRSSPAARSRQASRASSCRARAWCKRCRPRRRASTRSSATPASNGASRAARCASAMNDDRLAPGERCASTSNRNFEGRQGRGGRTHLMSPAMAAAAAIAGRIADVRDAGDA